MRKPAALLAAVAALLLAPAAAHGAFTLSLEGSAGDLRYRLTGTTAADELRMVATNALIGSGDVDEIVFTANATMTISGADTAEECGVGSIVECELDTAAGRIQRIEIDSGGGVDEIDYDDNGDAVFGSCFNCISLPLDVDGGSGNDDIDGSDTNDIELRGGTGNDTISGGGGEDSIDGDDASTGTDGADTLSGGLDDDNIDGEGGGDVLNGGAGADVLLGRDGADQLNGQDGDDLTLDGGTGNDTITGGDGEDGLQGGEDDDTLTGGPESDSVSGGPGAGDRIRYDEPNRATAVVVDLSTTAGTDGSPLEAEDAVAVERVTGTALGDAITGSAEANVLDGAGGDDALDGGAGPDVLDGGGGADTLDYSSRAEALTVTIADDALANDGGDTDGPPGARDNARAVETVLGGSGADDLSTQAAAVTLVGAAGDDRLAGAAGDDLLVGGPGADVIDGFGGTDRATYAEPERTEGVTVTIGAGAGDDGSAFDVGAGNLRDSVAGIEVLDGTGFGDALTGDGSANTLNGGGGDDVLGGGGGPDVLRGGDGSDTASYAERGEGVTVSLDGVANDGAPGEGDDVGGDVENAAGGAGADVLNGGDGGNVLDGNGGADTLVGAGGVDTLRAGDGNDVVRALDGAGEAVDCGAGADSFEADAADQLTGCEVDVNDGDGDGVPAALDCDDGNPAIRQGATEVRGNDVDENCDGVKEPFPITSATVTFDILRSRFVSLRAVRLPAGAVVTLTCRNRGERRLPRRRRSCAFSKKTFRHPRATARRELKRHFKRRVLRRNTVVRVTIVVPDEIGKRVQLKIARKRIVRKVTCLPPGGRPFDCT